MTTRWFAPALVVALVAGLWGGPAAHAAQRWAPLTMSYGGHTWSAHLKQPLFRDVVMIPGQREVRAFYVRNRGDGTARLAVRVVMGDPTDWARSKNFRLSVGHRGQWTRVTASGQKAAHLVIPQGAVRRLRVRIDLLRGAGNSTQLRSLNFNIKLRLTHKGR